MWSTPEDLRRLIGVTSADIPDGDAVRWIQQAQEVARADTGIIMNSVTLTGSIDGINTEFKVPITPIGDKDFDLDVTIDDVDAYGFSDKDNEATKVKLILSSVSPNTGLLVFATAPSKGYETLKATYVNSWVNENKEIIKLATNLMAGYLYGISEFGLVPTEIRLGSMVMRNYLTGRQWAHLSLPYRRFYTEYQVMISPIRIKVLERLERTDMEMEDREPNIWVG